MNEVVGLNKYILQTLSLSNLVSRDHEWFVVAEAPNNRTLVVVFNQNGCASGAAVMRRGKFLKLYFFQIMLFNLTIVFILLIT